MRGLSLTQPWATLVAIGAKKIETRSWGTPYRGLVAIQAAKAYPADARAFALDSLATSRLIAGMTHLHLPYRHDFPDDLPRGCIVAVAGLVDCRYTGAQGQLVASWPFDVSVEERAFGDFTRGRFGWLLDDIRPLGEPIPCRGALGLWEVPAEVAALIDTQIGVSR